MITKDRMRADIANAIDMDASEIGDDDNLFDLGLDSIRVMDMLMKWEAAGLKIDFSLFYEVATLAEWWRIVERSGETPA